MVGRRDTVGFLTGLNFHRPFAKCPRRGSPQDTSSSELLLYSFGSVLIAFEYSRISRQRFDVLSFQRSDSRRDEIKDGHKRLNYNALREPVRNQQERQSEIVLDTQSVHDAFMTEDELIKLRHDVDRHESDLDALLKRIESLDKDVGDLVLLFKHLVESCASGRELTFTGFRTSEQAQAKYDFNLILDDVLKRRGLDLPPD